MTSFNSHSLYINTDSTEHYRDYYKPIELGYDDSDMFLIVKPSAFSRRQRRILQQSPRLTTPKPLSATFAS